GAGVDHSMRGHEPCFRMARRAWAFGALAGAALLLSGCVTSNDQGPAPPLASPVMEQIREIDLSARSPQRATGVRETGSISAVRAEAYYGDGAPAIARPGNRGGQSTDGPTTTGALTEGPSRPPSGPGYEMNFENAPVATVAKAILADILGFGYTL